jgi:hypothetical protein
MELQINCLKYTADIGSGVSNQNTLKRTLRPICIFQLIQVFYGFPSNMITVARGSQQDDV